jgi:hypothetical protein
VDRPTICGEAGRHRHHHQPSHHAFELELEKPNVGGCYDVRKPRLGALGGSILCGEGTVFSSFASPNIQSPLVLFTSNEKKVTIWQGQFELLRPLISAVRPCKAAAISQRLNGPDNFVQTIKGTT